MLILAGLAVLPDVDFVLNAAAPSIDAFAHRGPSHSLAVAATLGAIVAVAVRVAARRDARFWGIWTAAIVASHGLLDWLGNTNTGVMLVWPLSDARLLATWHLLPSPFWPDLLTPHGVGEVLVEFVVFLPLWLYGFLPRQARTAAPSTP